MEKEINIEKIKSIVLEKIKKGEVCMHSKIYFTLKVILLSVVIFLTLITSSLLLSFMIFSLRISGRLFLLGFGYTGVKVFLTLFPWLLLAVEIALLLILEKLFRFFKFGYRNPLIYIFAGSLVLTFVAGYFINSTPLHKNMMNRAEQRRLPLLGNFYNDLRMPPPREKGFFKGTIKKMQDGEFYLQTDDLGDELKVIAPPNIKSKKRPLRVGDKVFIGGKMEKGSIKASGVGKIESEN